MGEGEIMSGVVSKNVMADSMVELRRIEKGQSENRRNRVYKSWLLGILSEKQVEIAMPIEDGKLILLPVDSSYDMRFFANEVVYQCNARVTDRYRYNGRYVLVMDLTSALRNYRRREFYRFSCALKMNSRQLGEDEDISALARDEFLPQLPMKNSVILDISGGGLRFIVNYAYKVNSLILCVCSLPVEGKQKEYRLVGKVLHVKELGDRPGIYEHRVQYTDIDPKDREEIIQYIFDEARKNHKI